jgi:dipeptidyl aminopeptidase/acylaminoacyl peptidase
MAYHHCAARAIALAGCFASFAALAQAQAPVEAFGNLPLVSAPKLSPDGKHIAMLQPYKGRMVAVILQTHPEPDAKPVLISSGDLVLADVVWAKNDRIILISKKSFTASYDDRIRTWSRAISMGIDGKDGTTLLKNIPTIGNNPNATTIVDVDLDDPDHILMALYDEVIHTQEDYDTRLGKQKEAVFRLDLFRVDVHSGRGEVLQSGDIDTTTWMTDGHGRIVARIDQSEKPLVDHLMVYNNGGWNEVGKFAATGDNGTGLAGLTEDGKALVQMQTNDQSFYGLVRRELASNSLAPLFFTPNYDVSSPVVDEWTGQVIGASYIADSEEDHYFDPTRQALQGGLQQAFHGLTVHIVSWDLAKDSVIVSAQGPRQPITYYLLDRTKHQTQTIASAYPTLQTGDLGEMKPYNYVARDGLPIPAYLTLPPGKAPKALPVVVMPHGGPDARDEMGFDWMAQFLANRGYAVLQPNYRGSAGYGHKFTDAGLHQWGLKMQDDISDGVKKMIADGIADPKRVCIVGASYGGYAALAGAAFTPDLYACAASWAGVSDLPVAIHAAVSDSGVDSQVVSFWDSRIGADDMPKLKATSPDQHADQIKCPILLMHGEGDTTVRIEQSELMNDALVKAGKKVEFIRFPGEDHYMTVADTRIRVLKELEKFLAANIGN